MIFIGGGGPERSNGLPAGGIWGNLQYTRSGKLFMLTSDGVYTSGDKGQNWHKAMQGLSYYTGFNCASSLSDGTILVIHGNKLMKSVDGGESWNEVWTTGNLWGNLLFVDDNDDIYIARSNGLYVSKDKTQTWTNVYTPTPAPGYDYSLSEMTKVNGSYYFYSSSENILTTTRDFVTYKTNVV